MISKIKLGLPNLWLQEPDIYRAIEIIVAAVPNRNYYLIHPVHGFSKYIDNQWKPILVENPSDDEEDEPYIVTFQNVIAEEYIRKQEELNQTFIKIAIGKDLEQMAFRLAYHYELVSKYRNAFWSDSAKDFPCQNLIISPSPCPEHMLGCFEILEDVYPDAQELTTVLMHIKDRSPKSPFNNKEIPLIAKSGVGLSESQFITTCLTTIADKHTITAKDITDAKMSTIKSNGILEIINPNISFQQIGGLDNIKDIIKRTAVLRSNPDLAEEYGISPIRRMLMVGVPGTGKSAICQATAKELELDLARTGIAQVMNKYIGQSEANMRAVFQQIKAMDPLCVWIDEFGRDLSGSGHGADSGTTDRVHGEFLTGLQELPSNSFLLCAANDLTALKPEMLRADRFDKIFFVGLPSHSERKHIFKIHLSSIKNQEYDYDALAEASAFMTGAEIVSLIKETKFYVVSEYSRPINTADILDRAPTIRNTIWRKHPDMIKSMYNYALEQWDWASTEQMQDARIVLGKNKNATKLTFT